MPTREEAEKALQDIRALFTMYQKQTPSSPVWFQVVDVCVGTLMADFISRIEKDVANAHKTDD